MTTNLSSLADKSSLLEGGRAKISDSEDIHAMQKTDWRDRLTEAVSKSPKSARAISLAAGLGPGYVHSILKEGKDPTVDNLLAIAEQVNVSLSYLMYGLDVSRDTEELIQLIEQRPRLRPAVLEILRDGSADS